MTATLIDRLALRAMRLAIDAIDDDVAMVELRQLAAGDEQSLEQAIRTCLAQPASLEHVTSAQYLDKPEEVEAYAHMMSSVGVRAIPPEQTAELLGELLHELG